jgi:hypothetical protein
VIHITRVDREVCEKCRRFEKGFGFHYEPVGIPQFFCYECFYARMLDCLLAVMAVKADMSAHAQLTREDLAND